MELGDENRRGNNRAVARTCGVGERLVRTIKRERDEERKQQAHLRLNRR
jgi:hypothetical protein